MESVAGEKGKYKMKELVKIPCLLLLLFFGSNVIGYELRTHSQLTNHGYQNSILADISLVLSELGLEDAQSDNPFGSKHYEVSGSLISELKEDPFEAENMPTGVDSLSLPGWLMRGAIREDDHVRRGNPDDSCYVPGPNPQYPGLTNRPVNHFYDPIDNDPLETKFGLNLGDRAPRWGIGSIEPFQIPQQENTGTGNHFSMFNALEAMYRALTGHGSDGSDQIGPDGSTPATGQEQEDVRNAYWATAFRSLGDVLHLIQDMAQPQHTRNDIHSGACGPFIQEQFTGHKSVFEQYIEDRATGRAFKMAGLGNVPTTPLNFAGYPVPEFDDYVSYFSTRHLDSGETSRRGLADYSNRGFFSAGTNLGSNTYASPQNNPGAYTLVALSEDWLGQSLPGGATIDLFQGTVPDSVTGANDVAFLTTNGMFDQFLVERGQSPRYTLTKTNYDDMANLLIPRAAAYGTGFLNYFFRGRLKILGVTIESEGAMQKLEVTIENKSTTGNTDYDLHDGMFDLFYEATDGRRMPMTATYGASVDSAGIPFEERWTIKADIPSDANLQAEKPFVLVYQGQIGDEEGLAGIVFGPERFYVSFYNYIELPGFVVKYDTLGNAHGSFSSGTTDSDTRELAVYQGNRYVTHNQFIYKNGASFLGAFDFSNGIASNSQYVFVADTNGPVVEVYTHAGQSVQSFNSESPSFPYPVQQDISANETRMCIVDESEYAGLWDVNGGFLMDLIRYPAVDAVWACASTEDRHYVYVLSSGIGAVQVYDDAGTLITQVALSAGAWKGSGIGASEYNLQIPAFYENRVYIIGRHVDNEDNEEYRLDQVFSPNGPTIYPYDAAADLAQPLE